MIFVPGRIGVADYGVSRWRQRHARHLFGAIWFGYDRLSTLPLLARSYRSVNYLLLCQGLGIEDQLISAQSKTPADL